MKFSCLFLAHFVCSKLLNRNNGCAKKITFRKYGNLMSLPYFTCLPFPSKRNETLINIIILKMFTIWWPHLLSVTYPSKAHTNFETKSWLIWISCQNFLLFSGLSMVDEYNIKSTDTNLSASILPTESNLNLVGLWYANQRSD